MADNKDLSPKDVQRNDAGNRGGNLDSGPGSGQGLDSLAGPARGNSQQGAGASMSGQYTGGPGAGTERVSGINSASPESNVGPAGAPQSSRGSATEPIPGGTSGAARQGESLQHGMGAAAAGGNPGTSAQSAPGHEPRKGQGDDPGPSAVKELADRDEGGTGGADSR